jgi:hypothetical protein
LTQALVAWELGINQSFLSKLEKGQLEPNFLLVEVLGGYCGVKLSAFATYSHDETRGHHLNDYVTPLGSADHLEGPRSDKPDTSLSV